MDTDRSRPAGLELLGESVALTGRLASMLRRDAIVLIERRGGRISLSVSHETTIVVVGREGWPLRSDGHITRKLERARLLRQRGQAIEILPEEQFLQRLRLPQFVDDVCRFYSVGDLTELLDVPRRQIELWQQHGLLTPTEERDGLTWFDYRQVAAARSLMKLLNSRVPWKRLTRSLLQLQTWYPAQDVLNTLKWLPDGHRLAFRTDEGRLMETNGQILFDFDAVTDPSIISIVERKPDDGLFAYAVRLEQAGEFEHAADAYRRLLAEEGPDADVSFNLANCLQAVGNTAAAIERLREVVALDRGYVDAWNNLGNLLAEEGRLEESATSYECAVAIEPDYADAQYGLADVLDQLGRQTAAQRHWRIYLMYEQTGPHADYARKRLSTG